MESSASIKYEPSLTMVKQPGFACCNIPNPKGLLTSCPSCGAPAGAPTQHEADQVVMTFPWLARAFFAIGDFLRSLARKIERKYHD